MFRIGTVPYLVARPLTDGLELDSSVQLTVAPPSELATLLQEGELDLALASSILALGNDALNFWAEGPVIACDGPIQSVLLFLAPNIRSPVQIKSLALDPHSRTGRELARICLRDAVGVEPETIQVSSGEDPFECGADAIQLIGDPALLATQTHPDWEIIDLGETWKSLTRLPFVFAGWISRPGFAPEDAAPLLEAAAERGLKRRPELVLSSSLKNLPHGFLESYLDHTIHYRLPPEDICRAIAEFGSRAGLDSGRICSAIHSVAR